MKKIIILIVLTGVLMAQSFNSEYVKQATQMPHFVIEHHYWEVDVLDSNGVVIPDTFTVKYDKIYRCYFEDEDGSSVRLKKDRGNLAPHHSEVEDKSIDSYILKWATLAKGLIP